MVVMAVMMVVMTMIVVIPTPTSGLLQFLLIKFQRLRLLILKRSALLIFTEEVQHDGNPFILLFK